MSRRNVTKLGSYLWLIVLVLTGLTRAQSDPMRFLSGIVLTENDDRAAGARVLVDFDSGRVEAITAADGSFHIDRPGGRLMITVTGDYIVANEAIVRTDEPADDLRLVV